MPLLNFNTKQNIYIQVDIFVQVPCYNIVGIKQECIFKSKWVTLAFFFFFQWSITIFQTFTGNYKFPVFAVPSFPSYTTGKEQKSTTKPQIKPQTQKQPAGTSVTRIHQSPITQAFKQEGV